MDFGHVMQESLPLGSEPKGLVLGSRGLEVGTSRKKLSVFICINPVYPSVHLLIHITKVTLSELQQFLLLRDTEDLVAPSSTTSHISMNLRCL